MPVPAVYSLQEEHGELAGSEGDRPSERPERDLGYPRADVQDVDDLVVQQGHEVAGPPPPGEGKGQASPAPRRAPPPRPGEGGARPAAPPAGRSPGGRTIS